MRRRGGAHIKSQPDPDYWDYDGTVNVGHTTGTFLLYDMTDEEVEQYQREQHEREQRKVALGFQLP